MLPRDTARASEPVTPLVCETSPRNVLSWPQSSICAVAAATDALPPISERTHVLEGHAVALQERRAEALAVVGEDDEAVGTRRVLGRLAQRPQLAVDAVERVERLRSLGAAVVGDLVVVGVVHVDDRRAAQHLLDDERRAQRPQRDVRGAAHPRVREAAVMAMERPMPARAWRRDWMFSLMTSARNFTSIVR